MSKSLYTYTRIIYFLLFLYCSKVYLTIHDFFSEKYLVFLFITILFLFFSKIYQFRRKFFSPSYLFIFVVVFLVANMSSFMYEFRFKSYNTLLLNTKASRPSDLYFDYSFIIIFSMVFIFIYLYLSNGNSNKYVLIKISKSDLFFRKVLFLVSPILIFFAFSFDGIERTLLIPIVFFLVLSVFFGNSRKGFIFIYSLFLVFLLLVPVITSRYIFLRYLVPLLFLLIIYFDFLYFSKIISIFNLNFYVLVIFLFVIAFSVVSELYKLSHFGNISFNTAELYNVATNFELFSYWVSRQIYRVFEIWTLNGGNVIDYVDSNGVYLGLTYVKPLSNYFGFEYINLAKISAQMVGSNYAQPGIIAEGYANFSFIGAILSVVLMFLYMEYFFIRFLIKCNVSSLVFAFVPFSSVIFDGGTLISSMVNTLIIIAFYYFPYLVFKGVFKYR